MTILLHGALGSAAQFDDFRLHIPSDKSVFALNFPSHGGEVAHEPFTMEAFAGSVLQSMDEIHADEADLFGYSMGGYVALWLAWKFPEKVRSVTTYGTKLNWTPEVATGMNRMFDPEKIEAKVPQLAESLAKTHGLLHWKTLCQQTSAFLTDLGKGLGLPVEAYAEIKCPVKIGWGDQDNVVTESESRSVAEAIPNGSFEILPGERHLIEQVDPVQLAHFAFPE